MSHSSSHLSRFDCNSHIYCDISIRALRLTRRLHKNLNLLKLPACSDFRYTEKNKLIEKVMITSGQCGPLRQTHNEKLVGPEYATQLSWLLVEKIAFCDRTSREVCRCLFRLCFITLITFMYDRILHIIVKCSAKVEGVQYVFLWQERSLSLGMSVYKWDFVNEVLLSSVTVQDVITPHNCTRGVADTRSYIILR